MPSANASGTQNIQRVFPLEREHRSTRRQAQAELRANAREAASAARADASAAAARARGKGSGGKGAGGEGSSGKSSGGKGSSSRPPILVSLMDNGPLEDWLVNQMTCFNTEELSSFVVQMHQIYQAGTADGVIDAGFNVWLLEGLKAVQSDYEAADRTVDSRVHDTFKAYLESHGLSLRHYSEQMDAMQSVGKGKDTGKGKGKGNGKCEGADSNNPFRTADVTYAYAAPSVLLDLSENADLGPLENWILQNLVCFSHEQLPEFVNAMYKFYVAKPMQVDWKTFLLEALQSFQSDWQAQTDQPQNFHAYLRSHGLPYLQPPTIGILGFEIPKGPPSSTASSPMPSSSSTCIPSPASPHATQYTANPADDDDDSDDDYEEILIKGPIFQCDSESSSSD